MLFVLAVMVAALILAVAVLGFVAYEHGHRPTRAPERIASAMDRVASTVRGALDESEPTAAPAAAASRGVARRSTPANRHAVGPLGQHLRAARLKIQQRWAQEQASRRRAARTPVTIDLTEERHGLRPSVGNRRGGASNLSGNRSRPVLARHGAGRRL